MNAANYGYSDTACPMALRWQLIPVVTGEWQIFVGADDVLLWLDERAPDLAEDWTWEIAQAKDQAGWD